MEMEMLNLGGQNQPLTLSPNRLEPQILNRGRLVLEQEKEKQIELTTIHLWLEPHSLLPSTNVPQQNPTIPPRDFCSCVAYTTSFGKTHP